MFSEEEHLDVLQNIEAIIVTFYRKYPQMTDYDVDKALAALIQTYRNEATGKAAVKPAGEIPALVYAQIAEVCDWRLGRWHTSEQKGEARLAPEPLSPEVMTHCLKRLRKSLELWTKEGGSQGYLSYISKFL